MEKTTESDGKKRAYHSRVRQRQAEETRRRILEAARSQFESCGYAVTTLEAIAEIAENNAGSPNVMKRGWRSFLPSICLFPTEV